MKCWNSGRVGALVGLALSVLRGCPDGFGDTCDCGLGCLDEGLMDGNAGISSVIDIDAFFRAVVDFGPTAAAAGAAIDAELGAIASSLEPAAEPRRNRS